MSVVSQAILLGFSNSSASNEAYWYVTIGNASSNKGYDVKIDSSKNVYLSGSSYPDHSIVVKYDASGSLQWQRTITADEAEITSLGLDSSNNIYVVGDTESNSQGGRDFYIVKLNNSGTEQWQRGLGSTGSEESIGHSSTDSSGNTYGCGYASGFDNMFLFKYNSSGTLQWQRSLTSGSTAQSFHSDLVLDSSGNVYASGESDLGVTNDSALTLVKYNSSGTLQWKKSLKTSTPREVGNAVAIDSSGNLYVCGSTRLGSSSNDRDLFLVKYNSSGAVQWERALGGTDEEIGHGVAVDSSDNVYVCGTSQSISGSTRYMMIAKFNSSGSLQWERSLGGSSDSRAERIKVDGSDNLYVAGYTKATGQGNDDVFVIKLPNDGSLTGTYGSLTYAATNFTLTTSISTTEADLNLTGSNGTLTDYAQSLTVSTSSFTSATTSL
tara:strand:+ start:3206 stop:4519 length:1314 start_codon:yes stop_codon:yes gene_type:complete